MFISFKKGVFMSKLYLEYLKRKRTDDSKYYLFKSGLFYIFLDEDARNISKITPLKALNILNELKEMLTNEWFRRFNDI